ncbi:DUF4382 domain-containing protein [Carboxylicivirga sp. M1479]|uniref:DUF4382 domain-containing protein n=1 Tax=Carboxylicivirga sp. M1479 TaxID=2594476 RepID=UPI0011776676|nr:DUF4382 domain-containing protein [Carboxylicivirga sp. M1479]TRX71177.1 DUF4382 domain-containing protein [Carboxylicivirga sp. M1479]
MKLILSLLLCCIVVFTSCKDDDDEQKSSMEVRLTDSPAEYEEVLIDILEVRINTSSEDDSGWKTLETTEIGVYDLLKFTNGADTLLADEDLPAGKVSQMRLILGDNNQIKKEGQYYNLETPSSQQSGLKFNIHADLISGVAYRIWIDFDAGRSIVEKGNGAYSLKPVIRTFTEATSGSISGTINPANVQSYIVAVSSANDSIGTYSDIETGEFLLRGVDAGLYDVEIEPTEDYLDVEIENINVVLGQASDLGIINLQIDPE